MRASQFLLVGAFLMAGLVAVNLIAQSQNQAQSTQRTSAQQNTRPKFEYATLTTQANQEASGMVYTVTWNAGLQDVIGRSTLSLNDARRRLSARLGGSNDARTNLSVLLTSVGRNGWRLVESSQNDFGMTRIFVRAAR